MVWFQVYSTSVRLLSRTSVALRFIVRRPPAACSSCSNAGSAHSATSTSTACVPGCRWPASQGVACNSRSGTGWASSVTLFFTMPGALARVSAKAMAASKSSNVATASRHGCAGASATSSSTTTPLVPYTWCSSSASGARSSTAFGSGSSVMARTPSTLPGDASGPWLMEPTPPKPPPYSPPSVALRKVLGTQRSSQPWAWV